MIHFEKNLNKKRWLAYFDLLGTRALLEAQEDLLVFIRYRQSLLEFRRELEEMSPTTTFPWFSDTLLMIGSDDSRDSFESLNRAAKYYTYFLIQARIPFRGPMSCDLFYCDVEHNILFGKALVEAYVYSERQDWIGFLLSPSAAQHLESFNGWNHLSGYAVWDITWKQRPQGSPDRLPAYRIGFDVNNSSSCIEKLREMMSEVTPNVKEKYSRTLQFLGEDTLPDG